MNIVQKAKTQQAVKAFAAIARKDLTGFGTVTLCILGEQLGLFKDLAEKGPATSAELAKRMGIVERYTREWLSAMACAKYLHFDPADQRFSLPKAHIPVLCAEYGPHSIGGLYQSFQFLEKALFSKLLQAFRTGGGIAYSEYDENYWEGQERCACAYYRHHFIPHYLPVLPSLRSGLERGAMIADLGCSGGSLVLLLAQAYPMARFVGYDANEANIQRARSHAHSLGVADRVQFVCLNVGNGLPETYDMILCFDVLHHMSDATAFLRDIRGSLAPGGLLLCQEALCSEKLEDNFGPEGVLLYGTGLFCCVPQALSENEDTPGPAGFPYPRLRERCQSAGFKRVKRVLIKQANAVVYEIRA